MSQSSSSTLTLERSNTEPFEGQRDLSQEMRSVLGKFCTGVAVITSHGLEAPEAMTVQTVVSVSLDPALVLFSPQKSSKTWPRIKETGRFCINILSAEQLDLSLRFGRTGGVERFDGVPWQLSERFLPVLDGCLASVECEIKEVIDAGDHYLVLGSVLELTHGDEVDPLLFYTGKFGDFQERPRPM